jgi:radical SAM superfamily enzyme YgiQ (UPF0313 family)
MTLEARPSRLHLFLVKPSKYDDEGYVVRHWRGVLPSNTLACLHGLTEDVRRRALLGDVDLRVHLIDEAVQKVPLRRMARLNRRSKDRVVVSLVGVQTNQFCRAADIALALRREDVPVVIGGFHVSGTLSLFSTVSPEIQELLEAGVSVVAGEVEDRWAELLCDAWKDRLKPIYRFINDLPDLANAPRPLIDKRYLSKFVSSNFGTIECSRGCPFNCSFCTIINVQGRRSRNRSPASVAETIRRNYRQSGVNFYFFTDDDFARNPAWEGVFDELIALRAEGIPIKFMIQVDVLSYKIPRFVEKAARAGCRNVFIGMESINSRNLKAAGKTQNHVDDYKNLIRAWHDACVSTHVGYIIGFPHDTEESVRGDVERLMKQVQPHRASFFMMTPLPGSRDHKEMVEADAPMSSDFNLFDSFHEAMPHPNLTDGAWTRAYLDAWRSFYSFDNMKAVLSRAHPDNYWDIFLNFLWYKNSALNEGTHPMIAGFFPLKDRKSRRTTFPLEGRLAHARRRLYEIHRYLRDALRLMLEMEELWLQTRKRGETERRVLAELSRMRKELRRNLRLRELQQAYAQARSHIPSVEVPSRLRLMLEGTASRQASRLSGSRRELAQFWTDIRRRLREGRIDALLRLDRIVLNGLREGLLAAEFFSALITRESANLSRRASG